MNINHRSSKYIFTAGCLSGAVTTVVFQPLDVIKTRLQLHVLTGNPNPGIVTILKDIYNDRPTGVWARLPITPAYLRPTNFWAGTCAALWRCVPGVGCYFVCLSTLKRLLDRWVIDRTDSTVSLSASVYHFLVAFTARSLVAVLLNPFLVVKTQIESGRSVDRSLWRTLWRVYNQAKWRGVFGGVLATITRDGPYSGIYFSVYSSLKRLLGLSEAVGGKDTTANGSPYSVTVSAAVAAFIATGMTQPADVLRAHRQLLLASAADEISGKGRRAAEVFRSLYQVDGFAGFWRGLAFRLSRRCGSAMVTWTLYEHLM